MISKQNATTWHQIQMITKQSEYTSGYIQGNITQECMHAWALSIHCHNCVNTPTHSLCMYFHLILYNIKTISWTCQEKKQLVNHATISYIIMTIMSKRQTSMHMQSRYNNPPDPHRKKTYYIQRAWPIYSWQQQATQIPYGLQFSRD